MSEKTVVPLRETALVLIDVQRDFCSPDGKMAAWGADLSAIDAAADRIERLAAAARGAGMPVVFVALVTSPDTDSPAMLEWYGRQGIDASAAAVCRSGTEGAAYYRIFPAAGDLQVTKQRYSAFVGTNLELLLRSKGIRKLVAAGFTTECCVESTVRDGFMRDYETFVVSDACAAYERDLHDASLKSMALNFATVVSTEQALRSWENEQRGGIHDHR